MTGIGNALSPNLIYACLSRFGKNKSCPHSSKWNIVSVSVLYEDKLIYRVRVLLSPFAVSIEDCADYMVFNMLREEHKTGAHFISNHGDETKKSRYYRNGDVRAKVWEHSVDVTGLNERT